MTARTPTLPSNGGLSNPRWRYVPACATDIRKTIAKAKKAGGK